MKMKSSTYDLVVVANRLPVDRVECDDGTYRWQRSPGGLVTALEPILRERDGVWIGWDGAVAGDTEALHLDGVAMLPVALSGEELELYYEGFCNGTLWPLYHDGVATPEFHREWWDSYQEVNHRFAVAAANAAAPGALVWVHDYQLQLVPHLLRHMRPDLRIGFFLHIPLPPTELFAQLPWRRQIIEGLMGADVVGFQRIGGSANFLRLVRTHLGYRTGSHKVQVPDGREVVVGCFPISIDSESIAELARSAEVETRVKEIREELGNPAHVFLGVDRLDYTKGIPNRLEAFGELLKEGRLSAQDSIFLQVATPSRERLGTYQIQRGEIEQLVGRINGDHSGLGRPAVSYQHSGFEREELVAFMRLADVMVVTPLRDGMNLVAKEYVASRINNDGALILSEFAGAADELRQAFLVNPYDIDGLKDAMVRGVEASPRELGRRMRAMRRTVEMHTVSRWASRFITSLTE
jgi:trehalose 6-phosphate synthase